MIIAVASGKGGTGKTTVAVNLARVRSTAVRLLDCDVEAPNAHLFLGAGAAAARGDGRPGDPPAAGDDFAEQAVHVPVPRIDETRCDGCGECSRFCAYNAVVSFGTTAMVFPELCHGCGGCALVCPRDAIEEVDRRIGVVRTARYGSITLSEGRLDVGETLAPPLIRAVKALPDADEDVIIDAPPGNSCPVVAALQGVDAVVLVTEPTPFGLHDLELAVAMVRAMGLPCGVVVNRAGSGDDRVHAFCRREGLPLLAEIPDDRRIAEAYARGRLLVEALPDHRPLLRELAERIEELAASSAGERRGA